MLTRICAVLMVAVSGGAVLAADTASSQLSVGVTVVRSCAVDARADHNASPVLRLTCTGGANSNLRLSGTTPAQAPAISSDGLHVVTLNF